LISETLAKISTAYLSFAAKLDGVGMIALRVGLFIVLIWIGGLKFGRFRSGEHSSVCGEQSSRTTLLPEACK
jgi:hypothetical protein